MTFEHVDVAQQRDQRTDPGPVGATRRRPVATTTTPHAVTVGSTTDPAELEADAIAGQVVRLLADGNGSRIRFGGHVGDVTARRLDVAVDRSTRIRRFGGHVGDVTARRLDVAVDRSTRIRRFGGDQDPELEAFTERLKEVSELTTLKVLLAEWDGTVTEQLARLYGIARFRAVVSAAGATGVVDIGPDRFRTADPRDPYSLPLTLAERAAVAVAWFPDGDRAVTGLLAAAGRERATVEDVVKTARAAWIPLRVLANAWLVSDQRTLAAAAPWLVSTATRDRSINDVLVDAARAARLPLPVLVSAWVDNGPHTFAAAAPWLRASPRSEREVIGADQALMVRAERTLPLTDYIELQQLLRDGARRLDPSMVDKIVLPTSGPEEPPLMGEDMVAKIRSALADIRKGFAAHTASPEVSLEEIRTLDVLVQRARALEDLSDEAVNAYEPDQLPSAVDTLWLAASNTRRAITQELTRLVRRCVASGRPLNAIYADTRFVEKEVNELSEADQPKLHRGIGTYQRVVGELFRGAPQMSDVTQGSVGDCWLLAPLDAVLTMPDGAARIQRMIRGSWPQFEVTLYEREEEDGPLTTTTVRVTTEFPMHEGTFAYALAHRPTEPSGRGGDELRTAAPLWPAVIEKAWAQQEGGYHKLEGGRAPGRAFEVLLGQDATKTLGAGTLPKKAEAARELLLPLVRAGRPVSVSTRTHYVAVVTADENGLTLRDQSLYRRREPTLDEPVVSRRITWQQLVDEPWRRGSDPSTNLRFEGYSSTT